MANGYIFLLNGHSFLLITHAHKVTEHFYFFEATRNLRSDSHNILNTLWPRYTWTSAVVSECWLVSHAALSHVKNSIREFPRYSNWRGFKGFTWSSRKGNLSPFHLWSHNLLLQARQCLINLSEILKPTITSMMYVLYTFPLKIQRIRCD